jgi:hypothetical protein
MSNSSIVLSFRRGDRHQMFGKRAEAMSDKWLLVVRTRQMTPIAPVFRHPRESGGPELAPGLNRGLKHSVARSGCPLSRA